jgi:hypothetical protein
MNNNPTLGKSLQPELHDLRITIAYQEFNLDKNLQSTVAGVQYTSLYINYYFLANILEPVSAHSAYPLGYTHE